MSLKTLAEGEPLVTPTLSQSAGIFIVAKGKIRLSKFPANEQYKEDGELSEEGKIDIISHKENTRMFDVGQIFND